MSNTNRLTASGLLYEGSDFDLWRDSLLPGLVGHYEHIYIARYNCGHLVAHVSPSDHNDIMTIIWWQVSSHVRSRVPKGLYDRPGPLLDALLATAQPFRLTDLPAEIRCRVYHFAFVTEPSEVRLKLIRDKTPMYKNIRDQKVQRFEYAAAPLHDPSLLSTNRQLRSEALPVYYQRTTLGLVYDDRIRSQSDLRGAWISLLIAEKFGGRGRTPKNAERAQAITTWASTLAPDSLKLLRNVSIQLPPLGVCTKLGSEDMLRFSLRPVNGKLELSVGNHDWLKSEDQRLLADHTAEINKLAQSVGAEGEALIMVLTSRPDIWDELGAVRTQRKIFSKRLL